MKTSLITIDGVLRKLTGGAPVVEGIRLYQSLAATGQIVLLSQDDTPQATDWLELNGCVRHDFVRITPPDCPWIVPVNALRREGYDIDLVVVPDPEQATALIASGFNTLLFTHSQYAQPAWRPDAPKGVRAWDDVVAEVAKQSKLKAADARLRNEE